MEGTVDQGNWAASKSCRRLVAVTFQGHHFSRLGDFFPAVTSGMGADPETVDGQDLAREVCQQNGGQGKC